MTPDERLTALSNLLQVTRPLLLLIVKGVDSVQVRLMTSIYL